MNNVDATLRNVKLIVRDAYDAMQTSVNYSGYAEAINALIDAADGLITVVGEQQRQIERLQDALRDCLENDLKDQTNHG